MIPIIWDGPGSPEHWLVSQRHWLTQGTQKAEVPRDLSNIQWWRKSLDTGCSEAGGDQLGQGTHTVRGSGHDLHRELPCSSLLRLPWAPHGSPWPPLGPMKLTGYLCCGAENLGPKVSLFLIVQTCETPQCNWGWTQWFCAGWQEGSSSEPRIDIGQKYWFIPTQCDSGGSAGSQGSSATDKQKEGVGWERLELQCEHRDFIARQCVNQVELFPA